ncbi:MAG: endonuclease III [Candidatus Paceibacterota bacterium]
MTDRAKRAKKMAKKLKELFPDRQGTALDHSTNWELVVAVVLSAQCTDKRVNKVTKKLFKKYTKLDNYIRADLKEFQEDIRSTGFYKTKGKNILAAAKRVKEEFGGKVPDTMKDLMTLPGVGRKTANVVLGNAFGKSKGIAVDTHVRRFAIRFDLSDYTYPKKIEKDLIELLPQKEWFDFGNNLIYYGREICPARPHECEDHPLTKIYPPAAEKWPKSR